MVALASTGVAAIIAVVVPWMTFRFALRQDRVRRVDEQKAQLYVDLLTEAYAEQQYFEYEIVDDETRERMRSYFHDLRLTPLERARLGARANIFASRTVNGLFIELQRHALFATFAGQPNEADRLVARMRVAQAMEQLEKAVRRELGTGSIELKTRPRPPT